MRARGAVEKFKWLRGGRGSVVSGSFFQAPKLWVRLPSPAPNSTAAGDYESAMRESPEHEDQPTAPGTNAMNQSRWWKCANCHCPFISPVNEKYCSGCGGDQEAEALLAAIALAGLMCLVILGMMWSVLEAGGESGRFHFAAPERLCGQNTAIPQRDSTDGLVKLPDEPGGMHLLVAAPGRE